MLLQPLSKTLCPQLLISVGEPTFIGGKRFSCAGKYKQRHLNGPHEFVCGTYPAPDGGGQNLSPHPEGSDLSQQNTNRNCEEKLWLLKIGFSPLTKTPQEHSALQGHLGLYEPF